MTEEQFKTLVRELRINRIGIAVMIVYPRAHRREAAAVNAKRKGETFEPVTMGHIRGHGVTRLLVYCESLWCNHSATLEADGLPDDTVLRPLGRRMVCTACGLIGADVRPDWSQHTNPRGAGRAHSQPLYFAGVRCVRVDPDVPRR